MSCNLITIQGGHKVSRPVRSLEEYLALRNQPQQLITLQQVRSGNQQAKNRLIQFNYSGHYPNGAVKGCKLPSAAFGFDLDDKEEFDRVTRLLVTATNPDRPTTDRPTPDPSLLEGGGMCPMSQCERPSLSVQEGGGNQCVSEENKLSGSLPREGWGGALTPLGQSLGLLMLERSARQGGHAVFRREMGKTILENQVRIAMALGCEMDTNAHDINRVYFSTSASPDDLLFVSPELFADVYDEASVAEEARVLEHREVYHLEVLPEGAHSSCKHFKVQAVKAQSAVMASPVNGQLAVNSAAGPAPTEADPPTPINSEALTAHGALTAKPLTYLGIEYSQIIKKWWDLYNHGQEPITSNRDVLTFELAVNLRHICGFDRALLDQVIPCYDGFPQAQKMKCIDSALAERRSQMPSRLKAVLTALRQENAEDAEMVSAIDEAQLQDDLYFDNRLPKGARPLGIDDSISAVGPALSMAVITAITPAIGALATKVKLDVHGKVNTLNLIAFIAGEFASGKGDIDPVIEAWMSEVKAQDNLYLQQEEEYRQKKRQAKNAKTQPVEPVLPVRFLTMNNTVANLAERLAHTQEQHAFSYTPEADTVALKWKTSISDFSVMVRQAYDASKYEREARSVDAVNVHINHLLWNVTMCGTPDALYRVVTNYTDGFQSRIAIARTPDNTFSPLSEKPYTLTERQAENIRKVAHLLPLMEGLVKLPKLEEKSRQWVEGIRMEAMKDHDRVMGRQRFRICVTAMRMVTCLMLCQVCEKLIRQHGESGAETQLRRDPELWKDMMRRVQTPAMLEAYEVIADTLLDNALFFFRERIEQAYQKGEFANGDHIRMRHGKNDTIFERLEKIFTFDQLQQLVYALKGSTATRNSVHQMLKNWRRQGLIQLLPDSRYGKLLMLLPLLLSLTSCAPDPVETTSWYIPMGVLILAYIGVAAIIITLVAFLVAFGGLLEFRDER